MPATALVPVRCVERHPTVRTIRFVGIPINLVTLCASYDPPLNYSMVRKVFTGDRTPSLAMMETLAEGLGMHLGAFVDALVTHRQHRD